MFEKLTGVGVDATFILRPCFFVDFGKNLRVGKNVFINRVCTFVDRGGIFLEDNVVVAPKANLGTINHADSLDEIPPESADFAGKRVAGFCTYDSTLGEYQPHFAQQAKNADVKESIALSYPHRIAASELDMRLNN